jgi:Fe-S-cluster formation regulator IscX/YfhJ
MAITKIAEADSSLVPPSPLWDEELVKFAQMDRDMLEAEDLTDDEAEAYERVIQRLATAT